MHTRKKVTTVHSDHQVSWETLLVLAPNVYTQLKEVDTVYMKPHEIIVSLTRWSFENEFSTKIDDVAPCPLHARHI